MKTTGTRENDTRNPETPAPPERLRLIMPGLLCAVFLAMLDAQIVATAIPSLVGDLGGLHQFAWVTTAYVIASTVVTPLYGKLVDLLGRKQVFVTAIALFLVGSAASGLAQTMTQLIVFRVLQGVGAGGLFVCALAIIGGMLSPREAAPYYGYFSLVFAGASLAGPPVGGLLTDLVGWRWVFFVNVPIGLAALWLIGRYLKLPRTGGRPRIDYLGVLLLSAGIITALLLCSWVGTTYAWSSPVILALGAVAVLCIVSFVIAELRVPEPIIPPKLFTDATFRICTLVSFAAGFVFLGVVNFLALFIQTVTGASPLLSGLLLLPMMAGLVASSMVSSRRIARTGSYRWFPIISMGLGIVSVIALSTMTPATPRLVAAAYMLVLGVAAGLNMQVLTMASQNTASRENMGSVSAIITFSRAIGTSLGITIFAAVFYGTLPGHLSDRLPAGAQSFALERSLDSEQIRQLPTAVRESLAQAYADSLRPVFLLAAAILAGGLLCAVFLKDIKLRGRDRGAASDDNSVKKAPAGEGNQG